MNRIFFIVLLGILCPVPAFSQDREKSDVGIIPGFVYEFNSFDGQNYHSFGLGVAIIKGEQAPVFPGNRNSLSVKLRERLYFPDNVPADYSDLYHHIDLTVEKKINRHLVMGIFASKSSAPLYGGLHTFQTGVGYGYEFIRTDTFSLILGGGLGVSDFNIRLPDGAIWPVLPLPIIRFNMDSPWIDLGFEFITSPSLNITIAPEKRIRFAGAFSISQFRGIEDLFFECCLWYRFFPKEFVLGDFAGIGIGIKNSGIGFTLPDKEKMYELNGYSVFGIIDLSVLQITGGYNFKGREIYASDTVNSTGDGYFISIQGSCQF